MTRVNRSTYPFASAFLLPINLRGWVCTFGVWYVALCIEESSAAVFDGCTVRRVGAGMG